MVPSAMELHLKTFGLLVLANQKTKVKDVPPDFPIIYKKQIPFYLQNLQPLRKFFRLHKYMNLQGKLMLNSSI